MTDDVTLGKRNPFFTEPKRPWRFKVDGLECARKSEVATVRKGRTKPSKVWDFGEELVKMADKSSVYCCYECEFSKSRQQLLVVNETSGVSKHLRLVHKIETKTG